MKKIFTGCVVFIALLIGGVNINAQTRPINISVSGIEYDDASFTKLKENIKADKKVSGLKQSFSQNTGKLTLTYSGDASALWDDVPASIKQFFKVVTIEGDHIDLRLKNSTGANNPAPANTSSTQTDDCKNCYWNYCVYDVLKSFEGKIFRGINKDDGTHFYNCDNGVLVHKLMMVNGYGVVTSVTTDTILISSGPIGTKWNVSSWRTDGNEIIKAVGFDLSMSNTTAQTLIAKGITTTANGKTYNDVIVINYKGYSTSGLFGNSFYSNNYYYAKGIGLIRTDTLNFQSDPVQAINKKSDEKVIYSGGSVVKNGIDESIVGLWSFRDAATNADSYYKFNKDGTFEFYRNAVAENNKIVGVHHWLIEERGYDSNGFAIIDLNWQGGSGLRYELQKKNDPVSGKPGLLLNGAMIVAADNKKPW